MFKQSSQSIVSFAKIAATGSSVNPESISNEAFLHTYHQAEYMKEITQFLSTHVDHTHTKQQVTKLEDKLVHYIHLYFTTQPQNSQNKYMNYNQIHAIFQLGAFLLNCRWFNIHNPQEKNIDISKYLQACTNAFDEHKVKLVPLRLKNNSNTSQGINIVKKEGHKSINEAYFHIITFLEICAAFEPFIEEENKYVFELFQVLHEEYNECMKIEQKNQLQKQKQLSSYILRISRWKQQQK